MKKVPIFSEYKTMREYVEAMAEWIDNVEAEAPGTAKKVLSESLKSEAAAAEHIRWIKYQKKAILHHAFIDSL